MRILGGINTLGIEAPLEFQLDLGLTPDWVAARTSLFDAPTQAEMQRVATIFAVPHFQQLIGEKQRLRGQPVADPWLVARAMARTGIVVSEEAPKPNSAKVPTVCQHFGLECITVQEMLRREAWRF